jgi:hypothetical protein
MAIAWAGMAGGTVFSLDADHPIVLSRALRLTSLGSEDYLHVLALAHPCDQARQGRSLQVIVVSGDVFQ